MQARVKKLARQAQGLDEKGKELFIHDFIVQNVRYDKLKKEYSHEIIGALGNGVAVCEGMAKAVKILCDELGIWCIIALSEANHEKGIKYRHAWNVIKIGGQYYHLDATFDNTLSKDDTIRYDYVNLSDKQIARDHEPVIWKVPACSDGDHFYYKEKKLSWTTTDEVRNRTRQAVKKGKILLFHWRGGYLTKEVLQELLSIFSEEAKAKGKQSFVSVNRAQAVLRVRFQEGAGEEQIEMERLAKQREREKAYREKRKAKKLAENGGEIVKAKVCPHCQKEFVPTSNRQIFCSKDCCYQARQDQKKADREAEKGNHYYRQRVCAVCGSTYWPTHSQQKFCSEECQKINHNEKSLEFYHKKQKEKSECKDLLQTKELVSSTNSSEIITIPA